MRWWFRHKSFERLKDALKAVRSNDYSSRIPVKRFKGCSRELAQEINDTITDFRIKFMSQERKYGRYEALLNTIDSAIIVADTDGIILWMNHFAITGLCGFRIHRLSALATVHPDLPDVMANLHPGQSILFSVSVGAQELQMKISMLKYTIEGEDSFLYTLENVDKLIEQSELEAQRKLISVLTHEIMNSLSPIISLSDTLYGSPLKLDDEVSEALKVINRRSKGLLTFVENYKKLSRQTPPNPDWVCINDIFQGVKTLYQEENVEFEIEDGEILLKIDSNQIEQVLINLIKNAIEACSECLEPKIIVTSKADHSSRQYLISVIDNGCGISKDALGNIFIPFFTTKAGGSGIGLSLSKHILNWHGGSIKVESFTHGTTVTISLPLIYRLK